MDKELESAFEADSEGYERWVPSEKDREKLASYLASEIQRAKVDYKPVYDRMIENKRIYKGLPEKGGKKLVLPVCKSAANYIIANLVNKIMNRKPLIQCTPDEQDDYEIMLPDGTATTRSAEEVAAALEVWAEYKFRKRIPMRKIVTTLFTDIITGYSPAWIKVYHHKRYRTEQVAKYDKLAGNGKLSYAGKATRKVLDGEPNQIVNVNGLNMLMPIEEKDVQTSPWIAERKEYSVTEMRSHLTECGKLFSGKGDPLKEEEFLAKVTDIYALAQIKDAADLAGRVASAAPGKHEVYEVYIDWPCVVDGSYVVIPLVVDFHPESQEILDAYRLPYSHGKRPYEAFFQDQDGHEFDGSSVVEDISTHQKFATDLLHLEIQNAVQANLKAYKIKHGSIAWDEVGGKEIRPGHGIPVDDKDDITEFQIGSDYRTVLPVVDFLKANADEMANIGDYQRNQGNLSRATGAAVSQAMDAGANKPEQILANIREGLSRVLWMYFRMVQQFSPGGEDIPFRNEETRELLMIPMRFPVDPLNEDFGFTFRASEDDQLQQAQFEQIQLLKGMIDAQNPAIAQMIGPMFDPSMPMEMVEINKEMIRRSEYLLGLGFETLFRKDRSRVELDMSLIDNMLAAKQQLLMEQQQMTGAQAEGQMGAEGEQVLPEAGGDVPPAEGDPYGGMEPFPPVGPDEGMGGFDPEGDLSGGVDEEFIPY